MATFISLVNDVLARLRESSVTTVSTNAYSTLIGKFVNDSKRQVEDAWGWDALAQTITVTTSSGTSNYVVTGSGTRPKDATINNTTSKNKLSNVPLQWIIDQQQLGTSSTAIPCYYAWNGNNGTDSKIELWPTPSGVFSIKVNLYVPQLELSADTDVLLVPSQSVIMGAYARALVERGEDSGLNSSEAYSLFKSIMADQIAIEAGRFVENEVWVAN
jgi:hypothetical protein